MLEEGYGEKEERNPCLMSVWFGRKYVVWIALEKEHESTKMPEETCLVFGQDQEGKKIEKKRKKEQLNFLELGLRKEAVVAEL